MARKSGFHILLLTGLVSVFCAVSSGLTQEAEASIEEAVIDEARGEATVIDDRGRVRDAREGEYVFGGEVVETGEDGFVRIVFPDGSELELQPDTRITINDSRANENAVSSILLFIGRIFAEVEPADGGTGFELETITTVCGVRGTSFTAAVGADGATRIGVDEGTVAVRADERELELSGGEEATVELGAASLAKSRYVRSEQDWQDWQKQREQYFMRNADALVQEMMLQVEMPRKKIHAQDEKLKGIMLEYRGWQKKQGLRIKMQKGLTPAQKRELRKMVRTYYVQTRALQKADNRMMAGYYLISRVSDDAARHPEKYSPEFIVKLGQVKSQVEELDIQNVHEQNRKTIEVHARMLHKIYKRYRDEADLKGRLTEEQKEKLRKHIEQRRKQRQK